VHGLDSYAVGDRLIFLENARFIEAAAAELGEQRVKNGMLGTVIGTTDADGNAFLRVRLDADREIAFSPDTYRNIDHGYAATVHQSQGDTVDRVFLMGTAGMDLHLAYVGMSRHRHEVTLYAPRTDFQDFEALAAKLGRSGASLTTLDFEGEEGCRRALAGFALQRGVEPPFAAMSEIRLEMGEGGAQVCRGPMSVTAVTSFDTTVDEAARRSLLNLDGWKARLAALQAAAAQVYRDPAGTLAAIRGALVQPGADPRAVAVRLVSTPETFASSRDMQTGLVAWKKWVGRDEALQEIATHARSMGGAWHRDLPVAIAAEEERRTAMAIPIPELSERASGLLREAEAARVAGGPDAWRQAARIISADTAISTEIIRVDLALTRRFGAGAFAGGAGVQAPTALDRAGEVNAERLARNAGLFEAVRRVTADRRVAEARQDLDAAAKGGDQVLRTEKLHALRDAQRAAEALMQAGRGDGRATPSVGQAVDVAPLSPYELEGDADCRAHWEGGGAGRGAGKGADCLCALEGEPGRAGHRDAGTEAGAPGPRACVKPEARSRARVNLKDLVGRLLG